MSVNSTTELMVRIVPNRAGRVVASSLRIMVVAQSKMVNADWRACEMAYEEGLTLIFPDDGKDPKHGQGKRAARA